MSISFNEPKSAAHFKKIQMNALKNILFNVKNETEALWKEINTNNNYHSNFFQLTNKTAFEFFALYAL